MKIRNLLKQARVFNLEHSTFVSSAGKNGVGKPEVLHFAPLEVKDVHEDVAKCVEIKNALAPKAGRPTLRVV